jgi:hypothetical protein
MKRTGLLVNKIYEKKRKILESEVTQTAIKETDIQKLLDKVAIFERELLTAPNANAV